MFTLPMHLTASVTKYYAQLPLLKSEETKATLLPFNLQAKIPPPDSTTSPLPSSPGLLGNYRLEEYFPFKKALSAGFIALENTFISTYPDLALGISIVFT